MRSILFLLLACAGCSSDTPRPVAVPSSAPMGSGVASAGPIASTTASADSPGEPEPPRVKLETVIDTKTLRAKDGDAMSFAYAGLPEGLLVVAQMPPRAFLVTHDKVTPLPDFFAGLRSPAPDWPADEFMISWIRGTLDDMTFDIYAPATEYADSVRGKPGKWKTASGRSRGAKPKQASWIDPATISIPIETPKGARLYETAPTDFALAKQGFVFKFDGPAKGETLPRPGPGPNGCKAAVLGHPLLTFLADGSLAGLGTLCTSGEDTISTAKLMGVSPPFQSLGPRLGNGRLAVEIWKGGSSIVYPLPGADEVADFAAFDLIERAPNELYVVSQVNGPTSRHAYVARFDGSAWLDITPPEPPEYLTPYLSRKKELYLMDLAKVFRLEENGWHTIPFERSATCEETSIANAVDTDQGDLFYRGALGCLWHLAPGAKKARLVPLAEGESIEGVVAYRSDLYVMTSRDFNAVLSRRVR